MATKVNTELIDNYRKENNLTVKQFCKKCDITKYAYYKFMKSQLNIPISILYNIVVTTNLYCKDLLEIDVD